MKFYDCTTAPSPRRVRIFLAEKGISVPTVQVDLRNNEQLTPAFRAINPDATVPSLELDNGTRINDAIGICVYFEAIQPQPALHGRKRRRKSAGRLLAAGSRTQRLLRRHGCVSQCHARPQGTGAAGPARLRADPGPGRARPPARRAFFRADGCSTGAKRIRRRPALQYCRHHGADRGRFRPLDQNAGPGGRARICAAGTRKSRRGRAPRPERDAGAADERHPRSHSTGWPAGRCPGPIRRTCWRNCASGWSTPACRCGGAPCLSPRCIPTSWAGRFLWQAESGVTTSRTRFHSLVETDDYRKARSRPSMRPASRSAAALPTPTARRTSSSARPPRRRRDRLCRIPAGVHRRHHPRRDVVDAAAGRFYAEAVRRS